MLEYVLSLDTVMNIFEVRGGIFAYICTLAILGSDHGLVRSKALRLDINKQISQVWFVVKKNAYFGLP